MCYSIQDATGRRRLLAALESEGVAAVPVDVEHVVAFRKSLPQGTAALVHDLAPWTGSATAALRDIRSRMPALPFLIYAPLRPDIGDLIVEAARIKMVSLQLMLDGPEELGRLKASIRRALDGYLRDMILGRVSLARGAFLTPGAEAFCSGVLAALASGNGGDAKVSAVTRRAGTDRRTLERECRAARLPSPGELLEWMLLLYASAVARGHADRLPRVAQSLGLDPRRVHRIRRRLHTLGVHPLEDSIELDGVLGTFFTRCMELRHGGSRSRTIARAVPRSATTPPTAPKRGARWTVVYPPVERG